MIAIDAAAFREMKTPTLLLPGGASPQMFKAEIDQIAAALPNAAVARGAVQHVDGLRRELRHGHARRRRLSCHRAPSRQREPCFGNHLERIGLE